MTKLLITGTESYIGRAVENYLRQFSDEYSVETLDMRNSNWEQTDFSVFDVVFHIAGIAHKKETPENAALFYSVNCDLAIKTAAKAKQEGVFQFIFMSSMSVYGLNEGQITANTEPKPSTNYGKSKLMAEKGISSLADNNFNVAILRPPMVYGKGCKGNFQTVVKLVTRFPVFPRIKNSRSMIYIQNLCVYIKAIADNKLSGLFFPQNNDYVCTSDLAKCIAANMHKKMLFSTLAGIAVKVLKPFSGTVQKAFGSLVYVKDIERFIVDYNKVGFEESIDSVIE